MSKQVALVVGGSRGIGRQIAIDLAKDGYAVAIAAKSTSDPSAVEPFPPDPNSSLSTISTVALEITQQGGSAIAIPCDVRDHTSISALVSTVIERYGRLDVLVYNSGAIWWSSVENTPLKRFMLLQQVNPQGLYATVQACLPQFKKQGWKARIIVVCPPIYSRFFRGKTAYAVGKVGMSVLVKGLAMDFQREGRKEMAVTGIWPAVSVQSAATKQFTDRNPDGLKDLRHANVFSDAVLAMVKAPTNVVNGLLDLDEDFLRRHAGVTDFSKYSVVPGSNPRRIMPKELPDLTVTEQDDEGNRYDSAKDRKEKGAKL